MSPRRASLSRIRFLRGHKSKVVVVAVFLIVSALTVTSTTELEELLSADWHRSRLHALDSPALGAPSGGSTDEIASRELTQGMVAGSSPAGAHLVVEGATVEEEDERRAIGQMQQEALRRQQQEQREQEEREEGAAGSELLPVRDACIFVVARGQFVLVSQATRTRGFRFSAADAWRPATGKRRRTGDCRFTVDDTCAIVHAGGCDDGNPRTRDECDWNGASFTIAHGGAIEADIAGATVQPPAWPCAPFPRCLFSAAVCAHTPTPEDVETQNNHVVALAAASASGAGAASASSSAADERRAAVFGRSSSASGGERSTSSALHARSLGSFFPGGEEALGGNGGAGSGSGSGTGSGSGGGGGLFPRGGQAWVSQHEGGGTGESRGNGADGGNQSSGDGGMKGAESTGKGMKARAHLGSGMGGVTKDGEGPAQAEQIGGNGNAADGGGSESEFKRTMGAWGGGGGSGGGLGGFKGNSKSTGNAQLTSGGGLPSGGQVSGFKSAGSSGGGQANQQQPRQQQQQQTNQQLAYSRQAPAGGNQMKPRLPGTGGGRGGGGSGGSSGGGARPNPFFSDRNGFKGRDGKLIPAPPATPYDPNDPLNPPPNPTPRPTPNPTPNPDPYPEPDPGPDPGPLPDYPDDPQPNPASPGYFSVMRFGAQANGWADDSGAFRRAFAAACGYGARTRQRGMVHVPGNAVFRIMPMEVEGPCGAGLIVRIDGAIQAFFNTAAYPQPESSKTWAMLGFDGIDNLAVAGHGYLDGAGRAWWGKGKRPMLMHFSDCRNLLISGITYRNPGKIHVKVKTSTGVMIRGVRTIAPWNSPNTDSISISSSSNVVVKDSRLESGDDGVGIVGMTRNVLVENVTCINGHGISIGSLGAEGALGCIQGVTVRDVTFRGSNNGLRIKTYQGGVGLVSNVSYENVQMTDVTYPIVINQFYCDTKNVDASKCVPQLNAIAIQDISFNNIRASCNGSDGIVVSCSSTVPCSDISLANVRIVPSDPSKTLTPSYTNAYGNTGWNVLPRPASPLNSLRAGLPGPSGRLSFSSVASQCHSEVWTRYEQDLKQQRSVRIGGIRNSRGLRRV
ncbi:hypothetical protein CLOM_g1436 [Closterium sp. NIES-68]|nr:hypothetical protein CLOM_g1436 [Closterium sp. NIES-68]GJP68917.1 hypothetical protein CLOP_g25558 [Closterium sp. NIES-67]